MKKYEVSEELLKELHEDCSKYFKSKIENEVPELFKDKIEPNTWWFNYENEYENVRHQVFRVIKTENGRVYGEDFVGLPSSNSEIEFLRKNRLATPSEVEAHLIKQWESMGGKDGVKVNQVPLNDPANWDEKALIGNDMPVYIPTDDRFRVGGKTVYYKGKWATIIPQEEVLTLEERVKRLEEKLSK